MKTMGKQLTFLLATFLLIVSLSVSVFGTVNVPVDFYESYYNDAGVRVDTNNPAFDVSAIGFICDTPNCDTLGDQYFSEINSGNTNRLTFTFPTDVQFPRDGTYGIYVYNDDFITWEIISNIAGSKPLGPFVGRMTQVETCRIAVDEFAVINDARPNEPIMVGLTTSLDATATSPIYHAGNLNAVPTKLQRNYQVGAIVELTITDSDGNVVNVQDETVLLDFSGEERVEFEYVPTETGRYTATVVTYADDGKCKSTEPHVADQIFTIIEEGPIEQCYVLLNNLDASEQNVFIDDTVEFTVEKIANFYDEFSKLHTLNATIYVDAFDDDWNLLETFSIYSPANENVNDSETVSFNYTPTIAGYHTVAVTAQALDCKYDVSYADDVSVSIFTTERPKVNTAPVWSEFGPYEIFENSGFNNNVVNVGTKVTDAQNDFLVISRDSQSDTSVVSCQLDGNNGLDCTPIPNKLGCSTIAFSAFDGEFTADDGKTTVCVVADPNANNAPTLSGLPNQQFFKNSGFHSSLFDLDNYASDVDGDSLSFSITRETAEDVVKCSIVSGNNVDCSVRANQLGCSAVTITVSDGKVSDSETFDVCIVEVPNTAPTLSELPHQQFFENSGSHGSLFDLDNYASDVDGDSLSFSITRETAEDVVKCTIASGNKIGCSVRANQLGCSAVTVTVSDSKLTDSETFNVCVGEVPNTAPVWNEFGPYTVYENSGLNQNLVNVQSQVTDAEQSNLDIAFSAQSDTSVVGCTLDSSDNLDCTPVANKLGCSSIKFTATDGEFTTYGYTKVCVIEDPNANEAPVLSELPDQEFYENTGFRGNLFDLDNYASDVNGDSLSFTVSAETNEDVVDCGVDAGHRIDCAVQANKLGCSDVTVTVSDSKLTDSGTFEVCVVKVPNTAPVWNEFGPYTVYENSGLNQNLVNVQSQVTDSEQINLDIAFSAQSDTSVVSCTLDSSDNLDCTPVVNKLGCSSIKFTATDGEFTTYGYTKVCVIEDPSANEAPVLSGLPDQEFYENTGSHESLFDLDDYASDVDGDSLSFSITRETRENVVKCNIASGNTIDCSVRANELGCSAVTVTVSDGKLTDSDTFNVCIVKVPNTAPVWSTFGPYTVFENSGLNDDIVAVSSKVYDAEQSDLDIEIYYQSASEVVTCELDATDNLDCTTVPNKLGCSTLAISAFDGEFIRYGETIVCVIEDPDANKAPVADFADVVMQEAEPARVVATLANSMSDVENDVLTLTLVSQSAPGIVACTLAANTELSCKPHSSRYGASTLTFKISDGNNTITETMNVIVERDISDLVLSRPRFDTESDYLFINQFKVLNDDCFSSGYACEEVVLLLDIRNNGDFDRESVRVAITSFELGVHRTLGPFDLDEGDIFARELVIPTYGQIEPGYYTIRLTITSLDGNSRIVHRDIYLG